MSDERYTASLPSLIHRIGREQANFIRAIATEHGCQIQRVRRSRNWQAQGSYNNLQALLKHLQAHDSLTNQFVIGKLVALLAQIEPPVTIEQQLAQLLQSNPNITLSELMDITQCDISQARLARFKNETL
ncbi:ribosome recycling factor family protein [Vibrio kasasachensis]|uniref:ribosome recycling factor family protein n=1 Tax=Vibrio kasasachensis TaxID=2910248 RepID=UPI003D0A5C63